VLGPARAEPKDAALPESALAAAFGASDESDTPAPLVDSVLVIPDWCPAGHIVGRIVDASGSPIAGASVDALGPRRPVIKAGTEALAYIQNFELWSSLSSLPPLATARSGGDGQFNLNHVVAGRPLLLLIDSPDGRHLLRAGLAALAQETLDLGDIALPDWSRVIGLVSDEAGREVVGAEVILGGPKALLGELFRRRGCDLPLPGSSQLLQAARTGEDGTFKFTEVPPVQQEIAVFVPGYAPSTDFLSLKPGQVQTADVSLAPGRRISGITVDEQGHPVPGATVTAHADDDFMLTCTKSDPQGRFEVAELPAMRHSLRAYTKTASSSEVKADAGASNIELVLTPDAEPPGLDVQVFDASGAPAHDFDLWCAQGGVASSIGSYAGLRDGRVMRPQWYGSQGRIWALAGDQSSASIELSAQTPVQGPLCLRLRPSVPVEGRVLDAVTRAPLAGAELHVRIFGDVTPPQDTSWCDQEGRFRIDYMPPGDVELRAIIAGHCENVLRIGEGRTRTVELLLAPAGTLVLDATPQWRRQFAAVAHLRVIGSNQRTVLRQDCGQVPCVVTALEPGHYTIEIESELEAPPRRSTPVGVDVAVAGITRFDLSALALERAGP
jgi:hypothetical protein